MSNFDPYFSWFAIRKEQQPPTFYHLLGVRPSERNPQAIEEAIIRQTSRIRVYQSGPYARECNQILNEIAEAGNVLLDPAKRRQYDETLVKSGRLKGPSKPPGSVPAVPTATPSTPAPSSSGAVQAASAASPTPTSPSSGAVQATPAVPPTFPPHAADRFPALGETNEPLISVSSHKKKTAAPGGPGLTARLGASWLRATTALRGFWSWEKAFTFALAVLFFLSGVLVLLLALR